MNNIIKLTLVVSLLGLIGSVVIHVIALTGQIIIPLLTYNLTFGLIGFLVFGFGILWNHDKIKKLKTNDSNAIVKEVLRGKPLLLRIIGVFCFYYATLNASLILFKDPLADFFNVDYFNICFSSGYMAIFAVSILAIYPEQKDTTHNIA